MFSCLKIHATGIDHTGLWNRYGSMENPLEIKTDDYIFGTKQPRKSIVLLPDSEKPLQLLKRLTLGENRVKLPSHKNFQLINIDANHKEKVVMQFGRIDENNFALDYRYPFTVVQAFAIALSSFHNRFRT